MKILHTSDWHIGRTFHGHSTTEHLGVVLNDIARQVEQREIDVVVVAGDIFDSSAPAAACFTILTNAIKSIRAAGAQLVISSGNHDSAARLGFQSEWAALGGVHVLTSWDQAWVPILIDGISFYAIPYVEPFVLKDYYPETPFSTHEQVLEFFMDKIRLDMAARGGPSVVLAHCFAAGVQPTDVERDISAGGLGMVSTAVFEGADYVALGHIHGQSVLAENIRYSGAPLYYSFKEGRKKRGAWLVEMGAEGLDHVSWLDLPVPRRVTTIVGDIDYLLESPDFDSVADDWVSAVVTDRVRPMDAMSRLRERFRNCATLEFAPSETAVDLSRSYGSRIVGRSDVEIVDGFLTFVRNGHRTTSSETRLLQRTLTELANEEAMQ